MQQKSELRGEVLARVKSLSGEARTIASQEALRLFRGQSVWERAKSILLFAPLPHELDIWPLLGEALRAGKDVALPRFNEASRAYMACAVGDLEKDVCAGMFGIREPSGSCAEVSLNRLDLILVPGIAFDLKGRRLGRGKGYYDRLLAATRGVTCGVAFDEQIVATIPVEPHDIDVDCILTPTRWLEL